MTLSRLEVDLWPEYDQPSVLVLYRITLGPVAVLPISLNFRIPASAGQPHAVAGVDASGQLLNIPFTIATEGEWQRITFSSSSAQMQIEYYDSGLAAAADLKSFTFTWPGDYAVTQLAAQVQQPAGASGLQIEPALANQNVGQDSLTYFNGDLGALAAGQTQTVKFSYRKSGAELSIQSIQPLAPTAAASPFASATSPGLPPWVIWALAGLGLVLIGGGGFWFWQSQRDEQRPARKRTRRPASLAREADATVIESESPAAVFCHNCGTRSQPGDEYCRKCGTRLRV